MLQNAAMLAAEKLRQLIPPKDLLIFPIPIPLLHPEHRNCIFNEYNRMFLVHPIAVITVSLASGCFSPLRITFKIKAISNGYKT
ncbi:hypothetical protein [Thalassospira xiamenensis]|uniref:hypothetical protein n=1 Tax=Thalassospira xiamenensis TaxID=220697 RepID=UPI001C68EBAA|nr:hypothetical protein [Thalassospira xiamenensis]